MGLDIFLHADSVDIFQEYRSIKQEHLSRTFCNFMCRQNVSEGEPELDQIGRITQVDIQPLYQMETYGSDEEDNFFLDRADSEEERKLIVEQRNTQRQKLEGNIDIVLKTVDDLVTKLSVIDNLPQLLNDHGRDTLNNGEYFSDFNVDKIERYALHNFGQDLRILKRMLELAKSKGARTVYFSYG